MTHKWSPDEIVWVDRKGDSKRASDGYSRYGAYVADREMAFWDSREKTPTPLPPEQFAAEAWDIASNTMDGLVAWRPDIQELTVRGVTGGRLAVAARIFLRHDQLAADIPDEYRDWELASPAPVHGYLPLKAPTGDEGTTVIANLRIDHVLSSVALVSPTALTGRALADEALRSVELTAAAINAELPQIIRNVTEPK